ncbi:putative zinc-binding oxidoreductase ToxD [Mycena crocata]|nr:putative zinc-binding oxidoreductase ToxD [Mycena crocata]
MSQLAIVVGSDKKSFSVQSIGIPTGGPTQILVKIFAAAQNPTDWKALAFGRSGEGSVLGSDFAGVVEAVGDKVEDVKKGERIAGWIAGSVQPGHGTYAQYLRVDDSNFWHIPDDMSFDQAASYSLVYQTASQGLYLALKLPEPYQTPVTKGTPILVWGGASSVGMVAIQLAKLSGLTVYTTASPKNEAYLKSLGADYVFPYNDPNTPTEIRRLTQNQLYLGYDAISEKGSTKAIVGAFGSDIPEGRQKQVVVVLPSKDSLGPNSEGVERHLIIVGTLLGKEFTIAGIHFPASQSDYEFSFHSYKILERLLAEKKIQPQRLKVMGGLENVTEGFEYMKAGRNSAEKIIYHPWETKSA